MKPRFRAEWEALSKVYFGKLAFESDEQKFSLRGVMSIEQTDIPEEIR